MWGQDVLLARCFSWSLCRPRARAAPRGWGHSARPHGLRCPRAGGTRRSRAAGCSKRDRPVVIQPCLKDREPGVYPRAGWTVVRQGLPACWEQAAPWDRVLLWGPGRSSRRLGCLPRFAVPRFSAPWERWPGSDDPPAVRMLPVSRGRPPALRQAFPWEYFSVSRSV